MSLNAFYHPNSLLHEMGETHLEAPIRIQLIQRALNKAHFQTRFIEARKAYDYEIIEIHSMSLLETLIESANYSRRFLTGDTATNSFTYSAALTAAGAAIQVAEKIKENFVSFAMVRPPGHHATSEVAMGFCFFNNIALTAHKLLSNNFKRIVILDVDNHHGNGTQNIFENNSQVLYLSLHADPRMSFPGTGFSDQVGIGDGLGHSVNIPLPFKTKDEDYLVAFDEVIIPIIDQFKPEAILVSLGLDGLLDDPYGALALSTKGYFEIGKRIGKLGQKSCKKRVGVLLEGGYKFDELGIATVEFFSGLLNPNQESVIQPNLSPSFEHILRNAKAIQRNYWFGL